MKNVIEEINELKIIDGHEHLDMFAIRKERNTDFFKTLHYLESDLITAGMPRDILFSDQKSDREKAEIFLSYWQKAKNTTYAQVVDIYARDLYGLKEWNIEEVLKVNEAVKQNTLDPKWFKTVLVQKANIECVITLAETTNVDREIFRPILFFDYLFRIFSAKDIQVLEGKHNRSLENLSDYLSMIDEVLSDLIQKGIVGVKLGHAYWRTLEIYPSDFQEAAHAYLNIRNNTATSQDITRFQDYLIYQIVEKAITHDLPIQIHTGHHETSVSRDGNLITNSKVTDLLPLLQMFPKGKFVLLHNGVPYHQEFLSILKNYPNTYADFTWTYIISDSLAKQLLHQTLDMVPLNKILGFGGDFNSVEGTYAHQKIARNVIGEVLQERCDSGRITRKEASEYAHAILRENYLALYDLGV